MTEQLHRRISLRSVLLGVCLSLTFATPSAFADSAPDIKKAAASYDLGRERFREGNYTEAAEKFEAADDYAPSAAALRLAIASRKEAGHTDRAATLAALALERHPSDEQLVGEAQAVIDELGPELAQVTVTCDSPCELVIDNRLVHGAAAQTRTLYVVPGSVELRANWSDNRTQAETLNLSAQDTRAVSFYAPAIPEPEAPPTTTTDPTEQTPSDTGSEERSGWSPAVFWTGTALTVAGAGASVALGINALNNPGKEAITENCVADDTSCPEWKQGKRNEMYANVAIGATAAVGVFTLVTGIWLTDWGGKKNDQSSAALDPPRRVVRPIVAVGQGAFFGAEGTF